MPSHKTRIVLVALFASATAFASSDTPGANPLQAKYIARSGVHGSMCAPQGTLKELLSGKYECSGLKGGERCKASIDAAKGKLDPKFNELLVDLMKTDASVKKDSDTNPDGHLYASGCSDLGGAGYAHHLAPDTLSYAKWSPEALFAQGTAENFGNWGAQEREAFIAAIGRYGDAHKEKILPVLRTALATKGSMLEFKKNTLKLMARFGSDDGVAYCLDVFKQGNDRAVTDACAMYFGERKTTSGAQLLVRRLSESDHEDTFTRALGLIGSKEAVEVLKPEFEKRVGNGGATRATVALLNIGDKSFDYTAEISAQILGKSTLSLRDKKRKAEELGKKRRGAAEKWKEREAQTDEHIAEQAAIEATFVTNAAAASKIDAALRTTAAKKEWPKAAAIATSALAQRGDAAAASSLVKLLSSPNQNVRDIAVNAFGASYDHAEAFPSYVGRRGVVVEASAVPALIAYIENEPNEDRRVKALHALGAVKSYLR